MTSNLLAIANSPPVVRGSETDLCRMGEGRHIGLPFKPVRLTARFEEAARLRRKASGNNPERVDEGKWTGLND
jgi:hypothetical protein